MCWRSTTSTQVRLAKTPSAERGRLLQLNSSEVTPRAIGRSTTNAAAAFGGDDGGQDPEHRRVASGSLDAPGEQKWSKRRGHHGQGLRRALDASQMPAAEHERPHAKKQDHDQATAKAHCRSPADDGAERGEVGKHEEAAGEGEQRPAQKPRQRHARKEPAAEEIARQCRQGGDDQRLVYTAGPKPRSTRIDSLNNPMPDATRPYSAVPLAKTQKAPVPAASTTS